MRIAFIGAGRLATNLAAALTKAGHEVVAMYNSRTPYKPCGAEVCIVAVPDAALPDVAARYAGDGEVWLHTAGSMPMDVFRGHATHYGVLYPMQTFSKERLVPFDNIPVFTEWSDDKARLAITALAQSVSRNVQPLSTADRRYLHLAAVFACNFSNHCYALAAELLREHGVEWGAMQPLVEETVAKLRQLSPADAQTGPAARGDKNVMEAQSAMLTGTTKEIYDLMSKSIAEVKS